MRNPFPLVLLPFVAGCAPKEAATEAPVGSPSGAVAPMTTGAAGGMTPVTGGASVEGAGSGVGQSAIGAAQKAAARSGSAASMGGEGGE